MWMFCGKTDNKSISKIHKRNLQLIYDMEDATLQDLLERDYLQIIYEDNIHTLLAEVYKSIYYISPPITWILSDTAGTQALCFKESLVWNKIPNKVFFNENKIFLENCELSFRNFISNHTPACFFRSIQKIVNKVFDISLMIG